MKKVTIGLAGAGTVGSGLIQILSKEKKIILERSGIEIHLKYVCDIHEPSILKENPEIKYTKDYNEIINDPSIDIFVELVGGTNIAYQMVKSALTAGKTVVTANKALLSEKGDELFHIAQEKNIEVGYEASVGGAIPIIRSLKTSLVSNEFLEVFGILNGTTNFILTKMEEEKLSYSDALQFAQKLGFAEQDPTFDVEGIDAAHKLSLLIGLCFGEKISKDNIITEGISNLSREDIEAAESLGYRIKLLGIGKKSESGISASVSPVMVLRNHPLASVRNETNAIYLITNYSGPTMLMGKGAGSLPTASAVISDLVFYGSRITQKREFLEKNLFPEAKKIEQEEISRYYMRFLTEDKPGVLAEIAKILGEKNISISFVRQNETTTEAASVIMLTHEAKSSDVKEALQRTSGLKFIRQKPVLLKLANLL